MLIPRKSLWFWISDAWLSCNLLTYSWKH